MHNYRSGVYIALTKENLDQLEDLAVENKTTKTEIGREAIRWYLDNQERLKNRSKETELAQSIKAMTDRICGMLARQGTAIGTLYELTWMGLANEEAKQAFEVAGNTAKQKMRTRLTEDEKALKDKMSKILKQGFETVGDTVDSSKA